MFKSILRRGAIAALLIGTFYPQSSFGKGFTSADILKWEMTAQNSYFRTSVSMAGVIASQNRRAVARCIDQWYFADKATQRKRADHIRGVMMKFPGYVPQAVIFAVIRKACGKLF